MNRLRNRLILVFLAATLVPVGATLLLTWRLLEHSFNLTSTRELDAVSRSLQTTGRALYQNTREALVAEVESMRVPPLFAFDARRMRDWPEGIREFYESGDNSRFRLAGPKQETLEYLVRGGSGVLLYSKPIGIGMKAIAEEYTRSRDSIERAGARDLRRGFTITMVLLAAGVWAVSFAVLLYIARRISRPMEQLTAGLTELANGNLGARLAPHGKDEVAAAMAAFNYTAEQLRQSREKLVSMTRLESWQTLARKMAHEVKNSLTPIRLTMEEIVARRGERDEAFIEQAAQIVVDEVTTLERRVRAFTQFASEPPVRVARVDVNAMIEDRVALLRSAHSAVQYDVELIDQGGLVAEADEDLVKGILTNLLENAAHAAGDKGAVLVRGFADGGFVCIEVHDSGPGLSLHAQETLFEPTISFKKTGMGLGLSIAKKSAMLLRGDIYPVQGQLGGAAFRVTLPAALHEPAALEEHANTASARR